MNTGNGIPYTISRKGACVRDVPNEYTTLIYDTNQVNNSDAI